MISEISIVIMADNFDNNLIMVISQIVEVVVVIGGMPQLFGLEPGSSVDVVCDYNLSTFRFGKCELVFKPVRYEGLLTPMQGIVIKCEVHAIHAQYGQLRCDIDSVVTPCSQRLLNGCFVQVCIPWQFVKPEVENKVVVISLVGFVNSFIVIPTVVVAKCRYDQSVWESCTELSEGSFKVFLDGSVGNTTDIRGTSGCTDFVRN